MLVARGDVGVSAHGYDELPADGIRVREIVGGLDSAVVVEDYPEYSKGPCMGRNVAEKTDMKTRSTRKLVREGDLVAEVEVYLLEGDAGWAPYLSLDDAYKLDDVREALKSGDVDRAAALASRVYRLMPVA